MKNCMYKIAIKHILSETKYELISRKITWCWDMITLILDF